MMRLTRLEEGGTLEEYHESMRDAQVAMFACMALCEAACGGDSTLYPFTFKAHVAATHLVDMAQSRGHPAQSNDMWVERMLRAFGTRFVRCVCPGSAHIPAAQGTCHVRDVPSGG